VGDSSTKSHRPRSIELEARGHVDRAITNPAEPVEQAPCAQNDIQRLLKKRANKFTKHDRILPHCGKIQGQSSARIDATASSALALNAGGGATREEGKEIGTSGSRLAIAI